MLRTHLQSGNSRSFCILFAHYEISPPFLHKWLGFIEIKLERAHYNHLYLEEESTVATVSGSFYVKFVELAVVPDKMLEVWTEEGRTDDSSEC